MTRTTRRTPAAPLATLALLLAATVAAAGCSGGSELTGTLGNGGLRLGTGSGGAGNVVPALVGRWFRLVYVPDSSGSVRTSETTLDLRADGTLIRTVVARQLSFGFADQVVSTGSWRATETTLTLTITTVGATGGTGTTGVSPIDSSGGTFLTPPLTANPPFTPNPPFGGPTTPGTTADSAGTGSGSTIFTYRIETTSQGSTLFLNGTPFVRLLESTP